MLSLLPYIASVPIVTSPLLCGTFGKRMESSGRSVMRQKKIIKTQAFPARSSSSSSTNGLQLLCPALLEETGGAALGCCVQHSAASFSQLHGHVSKHGYGSNASHHPSDARCNTANEIQIRAIGTKRCADGTVPLQSHYKLCSGPTEPLRPRFFWARFRCVGRCCHRAAAARCRRVCAGRQGGTDGWVPCSGARILAAKPEEGVKREWQQCLQKTTLQLPQAA